MSEITQRALPKPRQSFNFQADVSNSQAKHYDGILSERLMYKGFANTLDFLKNRGCLLDFNMSGKDERGRHFNVDLVYYDEFGNEISAKDAYKDLSRKFHGKGIGKKAREKQLKKLEEKVDTSRSLSRVSALRALQKQRASLSKDVAVEKKKVPFIFGMKPMRE